MNTQPIEEVEVQFSIPMPYNGGEWRISRQITGPRGGKHWVAIISQPATGGEYRTFIAPGTYKETYWTNGWATSTILTIDEQGVIHREDV